MKVAKLLPFFILFFGPLLYSQENPRTLDEQITEIIDKSNRYQDYKVVKMDKLSSLKKSVSDSLIALKKEIQILQVTLTEKQNTIDSISVAHNQLSDALATSRKKEDGISFFGSIIKKSVYQFIVWGIVGFLFLILLVFIYKYKKSNTITKQSREKLIETETEFDTHRQNALEREQQLRRKLQDELNKQKKS